MPRESSKMSFIFSYALASRVYHSSLRKKVCVLFWVVVACLQPGLLVKCCCAARPNKAVGVISSVLALCAFVKNKPSLPNVKDSESGISSVNFMSHGCLNKDNSLLHRIMPDRSH